MDAHEEKLRKAKELILRADAMLSYLWYRGSINKRKVQNDDLTIDLDQLLTDLRTFD